VSRLVTVCLAFVLVFAAATASGTVVHVDHAGAGDHLTIQEGIDAASAGDTLLVAPGIYSGPGNRDLDFVGKNLTLLSSIGRDSTFIDCGGTPEEFHRGFFFHSGEDTTSLVSGFTITNAVADSGGAFFVRGGASPRIHDCAVLSNAAKVGGGLCSVSSFPIVRYSLFDANDADAGRRRYGGGAVYGEFSGLTFLDVDFTGNHAEVNLGYGGAVHVRACVLQMTGCALTDNYSDYGGGLFSAYSTVTVTGCSFVANSTNGAGGVWCDSVTYGTFEDCTFTGNDGFFGGGGMHCSWWSNVSITGCTFTANESSGAGAGLRADGASPIVTDCTFYGNVVFSGSGGGVTCRASAQPQFVGCVFDSNSAFGAAGGGLESVNSIPVLEDCTFTRNYATIFGGGIFCASSPAVLTDCSFADNVTGGSGGGMYLTDMADASVNSCSFVGNAAHAGGALFCVSATPVLDECLFVGNVADTLPGSYGGAIVCKGADVEVTSSTLVGNGAPAGGTFYFEDSSPVIANTIIAFGTEGEAVACVGSSVPIVSCTDIYGNAGGDWAGCIADQATFSGNFSADPLFVDAHGGDYRLLPDSPCADASGCGLVGAFVAVYAEEPYITAVRDVGNDEGGWVRVSWYRSAHDAAGDSLYTTSYALYRRPPATRGGRSPIGEWDFLESIPATGEPEYNFVAGTLCDSTASGGTCWSAFAVRAMTSRPVVYFDSQPDSGYSYDNVAPARPANLFVGGGEGGTLVLNWDPNEEGDLDRYAVYRDTVPEFELGEPIAFVTTESFEENPPSVECWYRVTAWDVGGNESEPSDAGGISTGVEGSPSRFALGPAVPNPFRGRTTLAFELPTQSRVTVRVFDVTGRLVRVVLDEESRTAGRHAIAWDGKNDNGRRVASGIYFFRAESESDALARKVLLLR